MRGFYFCINNREYFHETTETRKTRKLLNIFLKAIYKDLNKDISIIDNLVIPEYELKYLKGSMYKATLEKVTTNTGYNYYKIYGNNFNLGYPSEDFTVKII